MGCCACVTQPIIQVMSEFIFCHSGTFVIANYILQAVVSFDSMEGYQLIVESDIR